MGLQICEIPFSGISGLPTWKLGVPRQNDIWVQASWLGTNNTMKGKVVASPKSGLWWVLWVCVCLWFIYAPKMLDLHRSMWIIISFVTYPSPHLKAPTCPSTLEVLRTKEHTPIPYPSIVSPLDSQLSLLGSLGVHHPWFWFFGG
jgi:hypothetical protein